MTIDNNSTSVFNQLKTFLPIEEEVIYEDEVEEMSDANDLIMMNDQTRR